MKKFLAIICAAILISGCGSDDNGIKIGTIKYQNVSEDNLNQIYEKSHVAGDESAKCKYIFFDDMSTMVAALEAGQIEILSTYETVGDYLTTQNQNFEQTKFSAIPQHFFCCALREEDVALRKEFDTAILKISSDGTLAHLVKAYIGGSTDLPAIEMPAFYGADTIKIGVTGDLPLLDYIRPDNMPAGFNTAVLSEISQRIGKNFVLVQIAGGARAVALTSGKVDVIFWAVVPNEQGNIPQDFDKPDGVILTKPYFADEIVHVKLKK